MGKTSVKKMQLGVPENYFEHVIDNNPAIAYINMHALYMHTKTLINDTTSNRYSHATYGV